MDLPVPGFTDGDPGRVAFARPEGFEMPSRNARALECDEDEEAFKANLRKIATAPS